MEYWNKKQLLEWVNSLNSNSKFRIDNEEIYSNKMVVKLTQIIGG